MRLPARILALALAVAPAAASAAEPELAFRSLSSDDGLAQNTVLSILQDSRGFVWLGTQDGLHRYDGHGFEVHKPSPFSPGAISHGMVQALLEDPGGDLWVGTFRGLDRYQRATGRFTPVDLGGGAADRPHVAALARGKAGDLWVGTLESGLFHADPTGRRRGFRHHGDDPASLAADRVWAVLEDSHGTVWVATAGGLDRLEGDGFVHHPLSGAGPVATSLLEDRRGRLWIGSHSGLVRCALPAGDACAVFRHDPHDPSSLGHDGVRALLEDRDGRLWIATAGGGLDRFDEGGGRFLHHRHDRSDPSSLGDDNLWSLAEDRDGLLWAGTAFAGVSIVDPRPKLERVRPHPGVEGALQSGVVRSFVVDRAGDLWVATDGGGLARRRAGEDVFEPLRADRRDPGALADDRVWLVYEDRGGELWVATETALHRRLPGGDRFERFAHRPGDSSSLPPGSVRAIAEDRDGRLWLALFGGGVARFDRAERRFFAFSHDPADPASLPSALALALAFDATGRLWVGTGDGLALLEPASGRVRRFRHDQGDRESLSGDLVRAVAFGSDGTLWVGTDAGLNRLAASAVERAEARFQHFGEGEGLSNGTVYAILEDDDGRLWLSTNGGLARFDPLRREFVNFGRSDGVQALEFNGGAAYRAPDGRFYFGGVAGYNVFRPSEVRRDERPPPLAFTGFRILGREVDLGRPISELDRVEIGHRDQVVSFELAALDFADPARNRYAYRLRGFSSRWIDLGHRHEVTFTGLDPGSYLLEIRGTNHDGVWNEKGAELLLVVRPAPWRTPWAYALYALVGGSVVAAFGWQVYRRQALRKQMTAALRTSQQRLDLALTGSGDGLWDWNLETDELYRARVGEMLGWRTEELPSGHEFRRRLIHPDDQALVERRMNDHLAGKTPRYEAEYRVRSRSGEWHWLLDRGVIVERDASGAPKRLAGTFKDITGPKALEAELRLWATVFEATTEGVLIVDARDRIQAVNSAFCRLTGWAPGEIVGRTTSVLLSPAAHREHLRAIRRALREVGRWQGEVHFERRQGGEVVARAGVNEVRGETGRISHYVGVLTDITEHKRSEEELRYRASYDPLTDLPNRASFHQRLDEALEDARRRGRSLALVFADLDCFKEVNDSLGHAAGDELLQEAARRFEASVRRGDTVARLSGDEFTVLLLGVATADEVVLVAERILDHLARPFVVGGEERTVTTSLGIAFFPADAADAETLLDRADAAMYRAKGAGRNRYHLASDGGGDEPSGASRRNARGKPA